MRYLKIILIILLFFGGCSLRQQKIKPGKKSFENEDYYIIKALLFESDNQFIKAANIYDFLYKKISKPWYFDKEIENLFFAKKYKSVLDLTKDVEKLDKKAFKYRIFALLKLKQIKKAKYELLTYFNKKDPLFYELMSYILIQEKKINGAIKYLKSLYALNHSKTTLLALSDLLIKTKKYNEALAYLRTHLKLYGCEVEICKRIAEIYKELQDFESLAYIYSLMGDIDNKYLIMALKLYIDLGDKRKALKLIDRGNLGDIYKLLVFESFKDYKNSAFISFKLYEETKNPNYLIQYCIYEFEAYKNKKAALEIIPKLRFLVKLYPNNAFLNNFLGYLLIDFDIDIKKGIKYVKKALRIKPDESAYIDSLAWGYYKLHKCKTAWEIIKNIDSDDKEIKEHRKLIKRCLNDFRKNNKQNKRKFKKRKKH
jgi:predicted Zn-dependent protease